MLIFKTEVNISGITGKEVTDFFLDCDDIAYQKWWRGTHFRYHFIKRSPRVVGSIIFIDEMVGKYRLKKEAIIIKFVPAKEFVCQFKWFIRLPAKFLIRLEDNKDGLRIMHQVTVGLNGLGRILDPFLRIVYSKPFEDALDEHVRIEFQKLRDFLRC